MKYIITLILIYFTSISIGQVCPVIEKRNNGNGNSSKCAGAGTTPMASNFTGTPYATNFIGLNKEGDITLVFDGTVVDPPAINRIWIENEISVSVAGPATVPEITASGDTQVKYCFYVQNLPPSGSYTLEFVDPQTNEIISLCGFDGTSNAPINPPIIINQPQSQNVCADDPVSFNVVVQAVYGGTLSYQWMKDGVDITGDTLSTFDIDSTTLSDAGVYSCLIGETNGSFIISDNATLGVTTCINNTYFNSCESGLIPLTTTSSWNNSWVDINNDGWEDLFISDKNHTESNFLHINSAGVNFTNITVGEIVNKHAKTITSVWADIDNDSDIDVLIVNATEKKSLLYANNGSGVLTELLNTGIDVNAQYFHGAAWADFDNDGYVDLLITNFFETRFHQLYKNNGNQTFTRIYDTPITLESNRSMAPILSDYNNDGLVDIFIPNGNNEQNSLYKNLGNFEFQKITNGSIATDTFNSVGASWGDYDNDGNMDLFVANASGQNNNLYKNNGDGTFNKVTDIEMVTDGGHSHGVKWVDINNDKALDLFVTNDIGANFLYKNEGAGIFTKITSDYLTTDIGINYGQAWADYNKDGYLDVSISLNGEEADKLFCNIGSGNNWLNVKLLGLNSNKSAIGARIKLKSNGIWQTREILPVSGFGSQNSIRAHFGLGTDNSIDSLVVFWPSGHTQIITSGLNINTFVTITEEEVNLLYGITFNDANLNNQKDSNEEVIGGIKMFISPSNQNISSNSTGNFQHRLADGTHSIEAVDLLHWTSIGAMNFTLSPASDSLFLEVPLTATQSGHDLKIDFATTAWRRGFSNNTVLQTTNIGTTLAENIIITMMYPDEVSVVSSDITFNEISSHVYEWNIDSLNPGEVFSINITDSVSLSASTGQVLTLAGEVEAAGSELDQSNNSGSQQIEVVGAIDPNDILVSPKGEREDGYIPKEQLLTYTIRFQNVGNYYATRVYIENQLPDELDFNSLEVISSSHIYNYQISEEGLLSVSYININLIDSTTNEPESHGFFKYSIKPKHDLMGGERILNQASLVFDYEDALETNIVHNTVKYNNDRAYSLFVYPNPASVSTNISIDMEYFMFDYSPTIESYEIVNLLGNTIHKTKIPPNNNVSISLNGINQGTYIIKAIDNKSTAYYGKLFIR